MNVQHQTIPPLAVDTKEAARLCAVSERHFIDLNDEGLLGPRAVRLKTCVRWNVAELTAWLNSGCPNREQWEAIREERFPMFGSAGHPIGR